MNVNQVQNPISTMSTSSTNLPFYDVGQTDRETFIKHFNAGVTLASLSRHPSFSRTPTNVPATTPSPLVMPYTPWSTIELTRNTYISQPVSRRQGISSSSQVTWSGTESNSRKRRYPSDELTSLQAAKSPLLMSSSQVDNRLSGSKGPNQSTFKPAWCPVILGKQISQAKKTTTLSREGCRNFRRLNISNSDLPSQDIAFLQSQIRKSLKRHGICVINRFNGPNFGSNIENEVKQLHNSRFCPRGQSMSGRSIRQDLVTWVDGNEPAYPNLSSLCAKLDLIVGTGLGITHDYDICGSTKAMVARYAGNGAGYQLHVDNPSKDGRCLTCIYYLNKNWDSKSMGGCLRLYSRTSRKIANIQPVFDRMVFFYSDKRNPHEVLPAFEDRYAVTVWYFDRNERAKAIKRMSDQTKLER